jgi:hypothetical protein
MTLSRAPKKCDIQRNDIQHNDTQHSDKKRDIQHNPTQYCYVELRYDECHK